tara:strand:+ start:223 stop:450 length:228 start_codon:yes stop_codon:yes gene_type:complete
MRIIGLDIQFSIRWAKSSGHATLDEIALGSMPYDEIIVRLSDKGMTQAEIGKTVGLGQGSISRRLRMLKKRNGME